MISKHNLLILLAALLACSGCKKYLDAKPDKKLAVPNSLSDYQSLLDNYSIFATEPSSGEISSDDYFSTTAQYLSLVSDFDRRTYIWEKDQLFQPEGNSWAFFSTAVYYCNNVLDGIKKIERKSQNTEAWNNVQGQALYFRGKRLFQAALIWTLAYDPLTANTDIGLPLRININFNEPSVRSSVEATYKQIISDVKKSVHLLPITPLTKVRASRPAAYALMSRIYLSMRDYTSAGLYADSCLQLYPTLMDYNELNPALAAPIPRFNAEVISENQISTGQILNLARARVSSELYNTYTSANDLRKKVFFSINPDNTYSYRARFADGASLFGGMASNETYLTLAECQARAGKITEAMQTLNTLLITRWVKGTYIPLSASTKEEALNIILIERRKELLFRGIRWMDIKRLNKEGANITLTRDVNDKTYILKPNDLRYALPIPEDVIALSGMSQNPR